MTGHSRLSRRYRVGQAQSRTDQSAPCWAWPVGPPVCSPGQFSLEKCSVRFLERPHWPDRSDTARDEAGFSAAAHVAEPTPCAPSAASDVSIFRTAVGGSAETWSVRLSGCNRSSNYRNEPERAGQPSCTTSVSGTVKEPWRVLVQEKNQKIGANPHSSAGVVAAPRILAWDCQRQTSVHLLAANHLALR